VTLRERLAHTPPGYRFSKGRILAIYSGLMVALLLAALDQTIVATALPQVIGALLVAVVLLGIFALVEARSPEPILPFDLLRNQTVASSVACMCLVGAAMFGTISFVPLFVQGVIGTSARRSGPRRSS
jgi:hypothetical protein